MDNLSHSVAGLAAGEFIHRSLPAEPDTEAQRLRRRLLLISCWFASNFPDLDIVLTPLLPAPLGYLLHHRGHTHTVLYALPQALLVLALIWLCWPAARRLLKQSTSARLGLGLALVAAFGLHLLMDYLNSYGIHPFHPYDPGWYFGDMVFILEPVFWVSFGIPLAMMVGRRWLKVILVGLLIGIPLYFTIRGFLPWASLAVLMVLALVLGRAQYKAGPGGRNALALAAIVLIGFISFQGFASQQARDTVVKTLQEQDPDNRVLDAAMTSFPTNPACWIFVSVEANDSTGSYRLRRGVVSIAPETIPAAACPARFSEPYAQRKVSPAVAYLFETEGDLAALRELKRDNCHFEAWLRFARTPWLDDGVASDLRFAASPRGNFTTMDVEEFKNRECSRFIPRWGFPREDLLVPVAP